MIDPLFSMALATGFLGTGHCIGMCGSLVVALSLTPDGRRGGVSFHLLYNLGRLLTYGLIGVMVGWLGSAIAYTDSFHEISRVILIGSDLFLVAIGLGSAGLFSRFNLLSLEFAGPLQAMTGAVRGLRKLPAGLSALPLGLLFGFLPCGFLYAMAIGAAQSADPLKGALTMLAFGLGTAPALLLFGGAAHWLSRRARLWMVRGAGVMVVAMGLTNLLRHLKMMGLL